MQGRRRFELKKGNKELFWEIWRNGGTITTRSGQLIREEQGIEKDKVCESYRQAEVEFDRLIRVRIQKSYEEVYEASSYTYINDKREVFLVTLKDEIGHYLNIDKFNKIFNWMVEPLFLVDKRLPVVNLEKWERRALRLCRFTDFPEDEDEMELFMNKIREITLKDRMKSRDSDIIPGFKFTDPQYWIINEEESERIFQKSSILLKKRVNSRLQKGQEPTQKQVLYQEWIDFNEKAMTNGGYEIRPISHRFESNQGTISLGLDEQSFITLSSWLQDLSVFDETLEGPDDIKKEILEQRDILLEQQKNANLRISRNETHPQRKKFESFRKKFLKATADLRSHSDSVGSISLFKFTEPEFFWSLSIAETKAILVTLKLDKNPRTHLQELFFEFLEHAVENKGFRLSATDEEEELIEYFVDMDEEEDSDEYEYSEDEYSEEQENEEEVLSEVAGADTE
jgi:hypothetical protein